MMIDELETIKACNEALDQIADGDMDGAIATISTLRADNQKKVDEFDKWAEEESKKQENMAVPDDIGQDGGVENFG
tara:strand:+ start:196 stop:423 length:228 start_codon:yes stop_codon:yes gene_type:complete